MDLDKVAQQTSPSQLDQAQRAKTQNAFFGTSVGASDDTSGAQGVFSGLLSQLGKSVEKTQGGAHQAVDRFSKGAEGEVHESMMAIEKADISFKFVNTVFKKGIDAYKEVTQRMG